MTDTIQRNEKKLNKVLIIRLSSIGDILLTTPLIRVLHQTYPDCRIDFVIKRQFQDLIAYHPYISKVYAFDKHDPATSLVNLKTQIRNEHYDVVIDIHKNFRSIYLRTCVNADRVVQFKKYALKRWLLVHFKINLYDTVVPVYRRYIDSIKDFGFKYDDAGLELFIPDHTERLVERDWGERLRSMSGPIIGMAPGASYLTKRWLPDGFGEVAEYLIRRYNARIIFFGNADDREVIGGIIDSLECDRTCVYNIAGKLSLMESASLLNRCCCLITNDTGLMHMATALKKKVIAIFGSTTRELGFFPCSDEAIIVQHADLKCRPCSHVGRNSCPEKHFRCMRDITASHVIDAYESLKL